MEALKVPDLLAEIDPTLAPSDDLEWALERVTRLCASAYVDAAVYRTKLLKGFGYPNETFRAAQDARALTIVLKEFRAAAEALRQSRVDVVNLQRQLAGKQCVQCGDTLNAERCKACDDRDNYCEKRIDELEEALRQSQEAQGWQPIETAPKDGSKILGYVSHWLNPALFYWSTDDEHMPDGFWGVATRTVRADKFAQPTLWHALPAPPRGTPPDGREG